jgi:hypothetical protein
LKKIHLRKEQVKRLKVQALCSNPITQREDGEVGGLQVYEPEDSEGIVHIKRDVGSADYQCQLTSLKSRMSKRDRVHPFGEKSTVHNLRR